MQVSMDLDPKNHGAIKSASTARNSINETVLLISTLISLFYLCTDACWIERRN